MSHINNSGSGSSIPGTVVLNYTLVVFAQSPYVVLPSNDFIGVDTTGGPVTILLPDAPVTGRTFVVKDIANNSAVNNITVTTVSGTDLIDTATTTVMNTDLESLQFLYSGSSQYYIY